MTESRGRIGAGGALTGMELARRLPLDDAAYLALAVNRSVPLATLDRKLAAAAPGRP